MTLLETKNSEYDLYCYCCCFYLCHLTNKRNTWLTDWRLLGCSTGLCSTIQIEQKLFDDLKSWDVRLRLCLTTKLTIVEHKINRIKSEKWLRSINSYFDVIVEQNINRTKSGKWLRLINVMYDKCYVQ